ncbi:MAG: PKD domain-containing protein, partial [Methanomassiliicoccales archaeon]
DVVDNGDFTQTATWEFDYDEDYNLYNVTMVNGAVNLSLKTYWWNETTQNDFDNIDATFTNSKAIPSGEVVLTDEMKSINLIKTGDFASDSDWDFNPDNNIISRHNASQTAEMGFSYGTGPEIAYLIPAQEDDGTVLKWVGSSIYLIDDIATSTQIGRHDDFGQFKNKRGFFYFNISSIPSSAIIDNVSFYARIEDDSQNDTHLIDIHALDEKLDPFVAQELFLDCENGTTYVDDNDSLKANKFPSYPVYHEWKLGNQAALDLQDNVSNGWFGIGIHEEGDEDWRGFIYSANSAYDPQLNVSYTTTAAVTFEETAYVNQTFFKPNVTPFDMEAVNLSFDSVVERFLGCTADLVVKIDGNTVWSSAITDVTTWSHNYVNVSQYMTESRNYNISLQLHMDVNSASNVDCIVKFDNVTITTLGYVWSGNYLSRIFDPGSEVFWDKISWNSSTPQETDFTIRTRSSPNGITWEDWSYEYSNSLGEQISSNIGRRIQYTVNLSTSNYTKTPILSDVNISYQKYYGNGTIEMNSDFEPENLRNWGTFMWQNQANGQTITYWYSIDSGVTWNLTSDGNLSSVDTISGKIRFRANFTTTDPVTTPTLLQWNLTYEVSELPTLYGGVQPEIGDITYWYNFSVRYSDPEGDIPWNITLNITEGTSHLDSWDMHEVNISDDDYTDGKWYYFNDTNFARGNNYSYHFAAKDPSGVWSESDPKDGPYVLNSPPKIVSDHKYGAQGGILYYNEYEAEDLEDESSLTWSVDTNASSWLDMNPTTGNLSGTPPSGDKGYYWVNVRVDDGHNGIDERNFTLIVGDTIPPTANAGEDMSVFEDEVVHFNGTNSTDNIGIFNYTWYFGDGSIGYEETPSHIYTRKGVYLVALIVKDILENDDIDLINVTVKNRRPVADAGENVITYEGELVSFNASNSYDTPSDQDSLVFMWDYNADGIFDDGVGALSNYTWYEPKTIDVKLRVTDNDGESDEDTITVEVRNIAPIVDIEDHYAGEIGSEILFMAYHYDPGNVELLFRWDWNNDGIWDTERSPEFIVNHSWGMEGEYTVKVEVWDGVEGMTDTATVEITEYNSPPRIGDLGSRQIRYNNPYTIDLAPFITDEDTDMSSMIVSTSDPGHVSINGVKITLIYPEDMIGQTIDVTVTVFDGSSYAQAILTVLITQNYPPTLREHFPDIQFLEDGESLEAFNLNDHFEDNDGDKLEFDFIVSDPNLIVIIEEDGSVTFKASPNWAGKTQVRFLAEDPSGAFADESIHVTVTPVNDPPLILGQIKFTSIRENENWSIDLDDYIFDLDNFNLTFTCNYPEIKIDPITHEAVWVPGDKKRLEGVIFSVSDGEHTVELDKIDLEVVEPEPFNWLYIILAFLIGILIFAVAREIRYRYSIEEVFLVDNAGVLLVHMSQGESKAIDAKLVSGMLTAVQEFVKDSFRGSDSAEDMDIEGALGKLEYGDFKIVIERGTYTFLSAVISGYDNKRLRKRMKDVVEEFEEKYSHTLADWDGDMAKFEGAGIIVSKLLKNHTDVKEISDEIEEESDEGENVDLDTDLSDELPYGDVEDVPSYYDEAEDQELQNNMEDTLKKD